MQVSPNAKQSAIAETSGPTLKIRLHAKPLEGAANAALIKFMSEVLGIPKSRITILSGHAGRTKRVLVEGLTPQQAEEQLNGQ